MQRRKMVFTGHFFTFTLTSLPLFTEQIEPRLAAGFFLRNPLFSLEDKIVSLCSAMCNANGSKFFHPATDFFHNYDSNVA